MTVDPNLLSNLPQLICDQIKVILPDLKECKPKAGRFDLEELKKSGIKAPAVRVSNLGAKQGRNFSGGAHEFMLSMAAFVVTKNGMGLDRDILAANICQVLLPLVAENDWGNVQHGNARDVAMQSLVTVKSRNIGASLWAVTWTQPITFYAPDITEPIALELYVGQSPDIGAENIGDYEQIGGQGQ